MWFWTSRPPWGANGGFSTSLCQALWGWYPAEHGIKDGFRTKRLDWKSKCHLRGCFTTLIYSAATYHSRQIESRDGQVCSASGFCGCPRVERQWLGRVQLIPWWVHIFLAKLLSSTFSFGGSINFECVESMTSQLDASENNGTPKSSILIGVSIINHPFGGYHDFRKHPTGYNETGYLHLDTWQVSSKVSFQEKWMRLSRSAFIRMQGSRSC